MCGKDVWKGLGYGDLKRWKDLKRFLKFKKIKTQPLCGEYLFWVPYLSFEEEDYESFLCMILNCMWLKKFSWGKCVYVTL
jgi:hypothetical protein